MRDDATWLTSFLRVLARMAAQPAPVAATAGAAGAVPRPAPPTRRPAAPAGGPAASAPGTGPTREADPAPANAAPPAAPRAAPPVTASGIPAIPIASTLPTSSVSLIVTPGLLTRLGARDAEAWAPEIAAACAGHGIDTPRRIAAFLANVMVETGSLSKLVESLNYSPEGLMKTWPNRFDRATATALGRRPGRPADQRAIAERAYGGRLGNGPAGSGDGWLFRGRGLIQLTGRFNYQRFADRIDVPIADLPTLLEQRRTAAVSAGQFWKVAGCNRLADQGDIAVVRKAVNGGTNGLPEVRTLYARACRLLAI